VSAPTLVLGVGNLLWADEGVGPVLAQALARRVRLVAGDIVDGGTQGLYLLPLVTESRRLLVFDAVDLGLAPGGVVVLEGDEIEAVFSTRVLSLHQTSLQDLLAAARLTGWVPDRLALVGVQVADADTWGGPLSPPVAQATGEALARAVETLTRWGEPMVPALPA
jgi:hydrogenase maturation protease